jgi:signal peptidase
MVVISDSMEPKINVYDLIVIRKVSENGIEEDDIITFETYLPRVGRDDYVTHYVRDIQTENGQIIYKTQGLNITDDSYDEWEDENGDPIDITYNDIEGLYMFKIPYIGRFVYLLRDPIFDLLLIANAGIIYLLYTQIKKYKKK